MDPEVAGQHDLARSYINNALDAVENPLPDSLKPADFVGIAQVHATLALAFAIDAAGRRARD
ncbi:MAG: hypothetical protein M3443_10835 [Actinomycetota bacterium]|nr:hypothetical protein [Actinomycetota bacterium]